MSAPLPASTEPPQKTAKRTFLIVVGSLAAVTLLLLLTGLILPRRWQVERTIAINTGPERVHEFVADFSQWPQWADAKSPDRTLRYQLSTPSMGAGAERIWTGETAGVGRILILHSAPDTGIQFESRINSEEPSGFGSITYRPKPGLTEVTWKDEGELPFLVGGFVLDDLQQRLGHHMEDGLAKLKTLAEN